MGTPEAIPAGVKAVAGLALWLCACNLLSAVAAAQCSNPTQIPNQTISSGTAAFADNNALRAASVVISGSASVTFAAGNCIELAPGFRATAGSAATTFHAWVQTVPTADSVSPANGSGLSQQFTWKASSPSGYANLAEIQALFNTSTSGQNACYIRYNRASNLLYLRNNAGTSWSSGIVPGGSGTASNSQCSISGAGSSVSGAGNQLTLTVAVTFQTGFSGTKNDYLIAYDNAGLNTGWQQAGTWTVAATQSYTATTVADLQNCIDNPAYTTCMLQARPQPYEIGSGSTIMINRSNVVVRGSTSGMNDTKLVRASTFTGDLIRIGETNSVGGVSLKYLTVCGASNITPNGEQVEVSPVGCPRVNTTCGNITEYATAHPGEPGQSPQCVDVTVVRSALSVFPSDPFSSPPATYAVEFDHVDLEDATGHALSLWSSGTSGTHINDVYFHDGAINYSGITGILLGDGGDYNRKFCDDRYTDHEFGFANDQTVFAPRNIRVEGNSFTENRTGVSGGTGRWLGFRNNTFTRNFIWPQAQGGKVPGTNPPVGDPNESAGGTLEFDACSDQVHVMNNTFIGPASDHPKTSALEMYGRNIIVDNNSISNYDIQGVVANSVYDATISNNTITFAAPSYPDGGITLSTVGAEGACTNKPLDIFRESDTVSIHGNYVAGQSYRINLWNHPWRSTGEIRNLTIGANSGSWSTAQIWQDPFVSADAYNGYTGPAKTPGFPQLLGFEITPRLLPVDAGSTRALCSLPGAASGKFTFAASDDSNGSANPPELPPHIDYGTAGYAGAAQILYLEGVFSNTEPPGGPSSTPQDCHFYFAANAQPTPIVYLDDGSGTWPWSSPLGAGGHDLTNPTACTIHAATSSASPIQPGQFARSVTLDVQFLGPSDRKKYIYAYTMNKNGILSYVHYDYLHPENSIIWQYWGWWQKP